ncbi:hypothetical protein PIB30_069000 [Stylosanthes scabra]|uniref:Uncharacterized protein n=1 Tax=Stylosanthes scabra TaxID=79078 RepID=A0ABU6UMG2_9FABA|nr:hypothetical protein [Stylosanthes scabra]
MKKLYRKGTVHPSPPIASDHLSFLPATILTLTVALSPQEREVLAYLLSCPSSSSNLNTRRTTTAATSQKVVVEGEHPALFRCSCFRCYMSYWARWDSSPNNQRIHEIIDAYEDWLAHSTKAPKSKKKDKRNKKVSSNIKPEEVAGSPHVACDESVESVGESSKSGGCGDEEVGEGGDFRVEGGSGSEEKGSVRRFVSFIGEKIWGGWSQDQ